MLFSFRESSNQFTSSVLGVCWDSRQPGRLRNIKKIKFQATTQYVADSHIGYKRNPLNNQDDMIIL